MTATRFTMQLDNGLQYNGFHDAAVVGNLMFQWGQHNSTLDTNQSFTYHQAFGSRCYALLNTCSRASVWSALALSGRNKSNFTVDRDGAIDGNYPFYWIAIGDAPGTSISDPHSAVLGDSDYEQLFSFPEPFADMNFAVITALQLPGSRAVVSLTRPVNSRSFVVDRDASIDGARTFHWLAIGR